MLNGVLDANLINSWVLNGAGGSSIKSIQNGVLAFASASTSVTQAVTSVDTNTAILIFTFNAADSIYAKMAAQVCIKAKINSEIEIGFYRNTALGVNANIYWRLIEYNNVKSLQTGEVAAESTAGGTYDGFYDKTITVVDLAKAMAFCSHQSDDASNQHGYQPIPPASSYYLSSATNLKLLKPFAVAINTHWWQVIEFN